MFSAKQWTSEFVGDLYPKELPQSSLLKKNGNPRAVSVLDFHSRFHARRAAPCAPCLTLAGGQLATGRGVDLYILGCPPSTHALCLRHVFADGVLDQWPLQVVCCRLHQACRRKAGGGAMCPLVPQRISKMDRVFGCCSREARRNTNGLNKSSADICPWLGAPSFNFSFRSLDSGIHESHAHDKAWLCAGLVTSVCASTPSPSVRALQVEEATKRPP